MSKVYLGEIGKKIIFDTEINLAGLTSATALVEFPDGSTDTWNLSVESEADGKLYYESPDDTTFAQLGVHKVEYLTITIGSSVYYSKGANFKVFQRGR